MRVNFYPGDVFQNLDHRFSIRKKGSNKKKPSKYDKRKTTLIITELFKISIFLLKYNTHSYT